MLNLDRPFSEIVDYQEDAIYDSLWTLCLNFHRLDTEHQDDLLRSMTSTGEQISDQNLFWVLIFLRGSFFSHMNVEQKQMYIELLNSFINRTPEKQLGDCLGIIGTTFKSIPSNMQSILLNNLWKRLGALPEIASRSDASLIVEFCEMVRRIHLELSPEDQYRLRNVASNIKSNISGFYAIEEIDLVLKDIGE